MFESVIYFFVMPGALPRLKLHIRAVYSWTDVDWTTVATISAPKYVHQKNVRPLFCPFRPCCEQPAGFRSRKGQMAQIISLWVQVCLGEFKTRRNRLKVNKRRKQPYIQYLVTLVDFDLLFIKVSSGKSGDFFYLLQTSKIQEFT